MAQGRLTYDRKTNAAPVINRSQQGTAADFNELKDTVNNNSDDAEARMSGLENNQITGTQSYPTYADLPSPGSVQVSYLVANDPVLANNAYYYWDGSNYQPNAILNNGLIQKGNINSVTGDLINRTIIKKSIGINKFNKNDDDITPNNYLNSSGQLISNSSYNVTGFMPVVAGLEYIKNGNFGGIYTVFYGTDYVQVGTPVETQSWTVPVGASYMRTTYLNTIENQFQVEQSNVVSEYKEYTEFADKINNEDLEDDSVNESKIADESITTEKTTFILNRPNNMYNPIDPDVVTGFVLDGNGNPSSPNASYQTTGFMPVLEGDVVYAGNDGEQVINRFLYGYDSDFVKVDGGEDPSREEYTVPAGVAFIRVSFTYLVYTLFQIERGSITSYVPYAENIVIAEKYLPETTKIKDGAITEEKIQDGAVTSDKLDITSVTTSKVADEAITEPKTPFFNSSINLFNPDDPDVAIDNYIGWQNGIEIPNSNYNASGYIPVTAGLNYTLSYKHQIAWYDGNKNYVSGSDVTDTNKTQSAPAGAVYLRCSILKAAYSTFQVEEGSVESPYVPYGFTLKDEYISGVFDDITIDRYENILGNDGKLVTQTSLSSGSIIEVTDFPFHFKKGISLSFYADLPDGLVSDISYGCGFNKYRGAYLFIGPTVVTYYYDGAFQDTAAHGLSIGTFVKSSFDIDDEGVINVILQSIDGTFTTEFQTNYECNYEPFIRTNGQGISNVKLTCTSKEFRHPVWVFGDSYVGVASDRWPGVMKEFNYFNFMLNGLAGQVSPNALDDLNRSLIYGSPKYLVWCLGMNDSDSNYLDTLATVISICSANNITLILSTIPTIPTRDKETIKDTVEASGYRYIDFYKAVGTDASGNWYAGYLSGDGVHPTAIGAQALATQVLVDFPELMQYGKTF